MSFDEEEEVFQTTQHLIFKLNDKKFAVPLSMVKEVIGMQDITSVPAGPAYYLGVINLRGDIISIINLKDILQGFANTEKAKKPCIIICHVTDMIIGFVVDDIDEVVDFSGDNVRDSHESETPFNREFIKGIGKITEDELIVILDLSKILKSEVITAIKGNAAQEASNPSAGDS